MEQTAPIITECRIQAESCQYTAAALYAWLRIARRQNMAWNALPIVFGALASLSLIKDFYPAIGAIFAMLAGLLPAIYEKLELQAHTDEMLAQAGQYKNLENRFRQAADIVALEGPEPLKAEFAALMRQIEDLRARPLTIPEKYFQEGRAKIKAGHYKPDKQTTAIR